MKLKGLSVIQLAGAAVLICFLSISCKKSNLQENILASMAPKDSTNTEIKSLAKSFLNSGLITNANEFSQKNGLPLWNQTLYVTDNQGITDRNIYFVPFKKTNDSTISAYMVCYRFNDSLYDYRLYGRNVINSLVTKNEQQENDLLNIACLFAYFEKKVNGRDSIVIGQNQHLIKNIGLSIGFKRKSSYSNDGKRVSAMLMNPDVYIDMDFMGTGGESGYFDYASWNPYVGSNQTSNKYPQASSGGGYNPNGFAESGGASATGAKSNDAELQNWWDGSQTNNQLDPGVNFQFYYGGDDPNKIDDLQKFFSCFNTVPDNGAKYSVSICVRLANPDDPKAILSGINPGHVFLTLKKVNGSNSASKSFGFFPKNSWLAISAGAVESQTNDNGGSRYNASLTTDNISALDFKTIQNMAAYLSGNIKYDVDDYNCTDYALQVFNSIRSNPLNVPDWIIPQSGTNYKTIPNGLYKFLDDMKGSSGVSIGSSIAPMSSRCQ